MSINVPEQRLLEEEVPPGREFDVILEQYAVRVRPGRVPRLYHRRDQPALCMPLMHARRAGRPLGSKGVREVERCLVRARLDRKGHVERVTEQWDTRERAKQPP